MYSLDRRKIALHVYAILHSLRKTAYFLQVSHSTISRWLSNPERKCYVRESTKSKAIVNFLKAVVISNPFITTREFEQLVRKDIGLKVSGEIIRNVIARLGFTRKKAKFFATPKNMKERVEAFVAKRDNAIKGQKYIVSIDETSFGRNGKPVYGYAPKGIPLIRGKTPSTKSTSTSVVAVIDKSGLIAKEHRNGAFNKTIFVDFLRKLSLPPNTVILLDNVSFHHSSIVSDVANEKGWELLFIPPYSPWYNPIEEAFSIVKRHYYKEWDIEKAFNELTGKHCEAFFGHALKN
jgi:transposase